MWQGRLREQRHGGAEAPEGVDVLLALDESHGARRDGHRADRLLVAGMTDVDDGVALRGADLQLMVDLGDQGADGVHDGAVVGRRGPLHLRR